MDGTEIAHAVLQPHFDAVRDVFAGLSAASPIALGRVRRTKFIVDDSARNSARHFAATRTDGLLMVFAPQLVELPVETVVAIVAHEFGHALDFAYPGCWTWPRGEAGPVQWVGEDKAAHARAWRGIFGKPAARSRTGMDDDAPAVNWMRAWGDRTEDEIEWAADGIAWAVTGRRPLYSGPCMLQGFSGGQPRPANLR